MKSKTLLWLTLLVAVFAALLAGCGGSGGNRSKPDAGGVPNGGRVVINVEWPDNTRFIHQSADRINVEVYSGTTLLSQRGIARPDNSIIFDSLPLYELRFVVKAFKNAQPTLVMSQATVVRRLLPGQVETIAFALDSTATGVVITPQGVADPQNPRIRAGRTVQLSAESRTATGAVLVSNSQDFDWSSQDTGVAIVDQNGLVTAVGAGTVVIRASERGTTGPANLRREGQITLTVLARGEGGTIAGRVTDTSGIPLAGVRVATSDSSGIIEDVTEVDGTYLLEDVPLGERVVTFALCGYRTAFLQAVAQGGALQVNATLVRVTGPVPTIPPVVIMNPPQVNETNGFATITGRVTGNDGNRAILIVNGGESLLNLSTAGTFSTVAVLQPGRNTIRVRAVNCQGSSLGAEQIIVFGGDYNFRVTLQWDTAGDIDLHVWNPALVHSYYGNRTIADGELDRDDTVTTGPENWSNTTLSPGRYRIGVNNYGAPTGTKATIRVSVSKGPNAGRNYAFGPYTFGPRNSNSGYPIVGNTTAWWRPADILVNGTNISVTTPDTVSLPQ